MKDSLKGKTDTDTNVSSAASTDSVASSGEPSSGFKSSYSKGQRLIALIGLLIIALLVIALIINAILGGDPGITIALLFCLIVIPCVLYGFRLYVNYTVKKRRDSDQGR